MADLSLIYEGAPSEERFQPKSIDFYDFPIGQKLKPSSIGGFGGVPLFHISEKAFLRLTTFHRASGESETRFATKRKLFEINSLKNRALTFYF